MVSVNNGQRQYIVVAGTAGQAALGGGNAWRDDTTVSAKQRTKGIYDIRARLAKFGEVRSQVVAPLSLLRRLASSTEERPEP